MISGDGDSGLGRAPPLPVVAGVGDIGCRAVNGSVLLLPPAAARDAVVCSGATMGERLRSLFALASIASTAVGSMRLDSASAEVAPSIAGRDCLTGDRNTDADADAVGVAAALVTTATEGGSVGRCRVGVRARVVMAE